jgi:hypothetical protein
VERYTEMQKAQGTTGATTGNYRKTPKAGEAAADPAAPQEAQAAAAPTQPAPGEGQPPEGAPPASAIPSEFKMKEERLGAWTFRFEGLGVGTYYSGKRLAPFETPCKEMPSADPQRTLVVFGAANCGETPFPEDTTLALLVGTDPSAAPKEGDKVARFVQAVGIFYGTYFAGRSNFPLAPGCKVSTFEAAFGPEKDRFLLGEAPDGMVVHRFEGDIFALTQGDEVEGIVLGPLPSDPVDPRWNLFLSAYSQYSLKGRDLDREIR